MADDPTFFTLKTFLHLPATEAHDLLGCIVQNFKQPWAASAPTDASSIVEGCLDGQSRDFKLGKDTTEKVSLTARLKGLLGINLVGTLDEHFDLDGKKIEYRLLKQQDLVFERLKANAEVQKRVPKWIKFRGPPVCLVTGILMYEDAMIDSSQNKGSEISGEVTVPLGQAASTSQGLVAPLAGTSGDLELKAGQQRSTTDKFLGHGDGRKIFALEVKRVTTGVFHREELRFSNKHPDMPRNRQLGGSRQDSSSSESEDSGPDSWGTKRAQQREATDKETVRDLELVSVNAADWEGIVDLLPAKA